MNESLKYALDYAERGWYVFPLSPGTKIPYAGFEWQKLSTNDPEKIKKAGESAAYKNCNWALDCGKSGIVVLDVDSKPDKNGYEALNALGELPPTLTVKTPSGGAHFYYDGTAPNSQSKLGHGLDTRGIGGYVVMPGSVNGSGGPYELIKNEDLPPIPAAISDKLRTPTERKENSDKPMCEQDQDHHISSAINYLKNDAPEAIEGSGGDQTTYEVACRLRDLGATADTAFELMLDHWNDEKAAPAWHPDDLKRKVDNAYQYAKDRPGNATPEVIFPDVFSGNSLFTTFKELRHNRKPPKFIVKKYLEAETTNLWFGEPGSMKSFVAIDLGVAIASGQDWAGEPTEQGAVFYLAGEGHGGIARRMEACSIQRGIDFDADLPFYASNTAVPLSGDEIATKLAQSIKHLSDSQNQATKLVIIDTLATSFGGGDENSTKDMSAFINTINTKIRKPLGCAVLIVHHSGHGDKDRGRGSSALDAGLDSFSKVNRDGDMVCLRRPGKMKDAEPFPDTWFESHTQTLELDDDLNPVTSLSISPAHGFKEKPKTKKLGKEQQIIFNFLTDLNCSKPVKKAQLALSYEEYKFTTTGNFDRSNYTKILKKMVENQVIYENDDLLSIEPF